MLNDCEIVINQKLLFLIFFLVHFRKKIQEKLMITRITIYFYLLKDLFS